MNKNRKHTRSKSILLSVIALLLGLILLTACGSKQNTTPVSSINQTAEQKSKPSQEDYESEKPTNEPEKPLDAPGKASNELEKPSNAPEKPASAPEISLTMLDVKQGLSILVESAGEYAIYDGGGRETSSYVVAYLKQHNIDHLKYMFVSHYDEDHIAGLVGVLKTVPTDLVIWPAYETDTAIYTSLVNAVKDQQVAAHYPVQGETYELGSSSIDVLSAGETPSASDNNRSVVVKLTCGDFSCLITGDAEAEEEASLIQENQPLASNLYIVGHHGSASSSTPEFVNAIHPEAAWISCGIENSYGHPATQTLDTLQQQGIQLFRTDRQGEVTCQSDGETFWFDQEYCDDWTAGDSSGLLEVSATNNNETTVIERIVVANQDFTYVVNTNTKRFHDPSCNSVQSMKEKNTMYSDQTRDELIAEGFKPCGNCHP